MQYSEPILKAVKNIRGGVILPFKKKTAENPSEILPLPQKVVIPMLQHIGAPCNPIVKRGDTVYVGTKIGDSEELASAPVYSSVSGTVTAIGSIVLPSGEECETVEITSDGLMILASEIKPCSFENCDELINAIRESGITDLYEPLHIKLQAVLDNRTETLIINCIESQPYLTGNYRECIENAQNILEGAYLLKEYFGFKEVIICVEETSLNVIEALNKAIDDNQKANNIKVMALKPKYPIGNEKMLIFSAVGKKMLLNKQPMDVGCVVINVNTASALNSFVKTGVPPLSKRITVDGNAIKEPKNVIAPIGTIANDVLEFCGLKTYPKKVVYGGPMNGVAASSTDMPIVKQSDAILVFGRKAAEKPEQLNCIGCGRCAAVCPMKLRPFEIVKAQSKGKLETIKKLYADHCIECGCCSYICPSKRDVIGAVCLAKAKLAKEEVRED